MLKTKATIEEIGREVANFLSNYVKVDRLILFGSYSHGKAGKDSDFDIAVISEDFERMGVLEKIELFSKAAIMIDSRIELKGFSKQEFLNLEKGSMLELIKNEGKVIYSG